jgi:hypothetical protein
MLCLALLVALNYAVLIPFGSGNICPAGWRWLGRVAGSSSGGSRDWSMNGCGGLNKALNVIS